MKAHGEFLAGAVGEIAGVSGTTIGQWARWGYIRASRSDGDPHVYAFEDVLEALMVKALLDRGVSRPMIRRAIAHLDGDWPLTDAQLATTRNGRRPRIVLREPDGAFVLSPRGWQLMVAPPPLEDVRLRVKRDG
ncbi:MerR family transcriptional regulator [Solirubrobacter sp. CPCC 204708]|uniref:MerR family transcriptional regulator n=1 Tax=Solirubrobacter deserti TaxID=2282478 RepID=A0ABT4RDN8_9ACTN|nr:MerR family transcriptional regulator [Solirubrobacter deserti]MBE2314630.1 MerR family transcriptional regulator [Solirubrobacter deserti]MDA0136637.1 MerR family transcriptional regulator [Solirubrobacter deserti]